MGPAFAAEPPRTSRWKWRALTCPGADCAPGGSKIRRRKPLLGAAQGSSDMPRARFFFFPLGFSYVSSGVLLVFSQGRIFGSSVETHVLPAFCRSLCTTGMGERSALIMGGGPGPHFARLGIMAVTRAKISFLFPSLTATNAIAPARPRSRPRPASKLCLTAGRFVPRTGSKGLARIPQKPTPSDS